MGPLKSIAKEGRVHILNKMLEVCPKSKENMSQYAPRIEVIQIKPSKIGAVIGPGGKQIRAIVEETGVKIVNAYLKKTFTIYLKNDKIFNLLIKKEHYNKHNTC